ncbi:MAG TPA: alpha/beta hydrolase [Candidatus Limnocylindrales bacterium]|nr:alpha/beta hydrolase [Candidatus Limnocylindrales bacterium]
MDRLSLASLLVVTSLLAGALVPGTVASAAGPAALTTAVPPPAVAALHATQRPCPDSIFTCVTLTVPRDHFGAPGGPTLRVTFAIHRATEAPRKGVFVTVTGGPGSSGIAAADSYTSALDPRISEDYDIVFFDQRGIGRSRPLQCPDAALDFYSFPGDPARTWSLGVAYAGAAKRFANDCVAETGVSPGQLRYFSTRQAVEDLELFRTWLGAPKVDLYGESYGTQYAQTYAAAHPNRVRALYLDGPVDLTLTGIQYYTEDARAFDTVLSMTLNTCSTTLECRSDVVGHDALAQYDALARRLRQAPRTYSFVTAHGRVVQRTFTIGDLETAAAGSVYSTYDRMLFQRALAQASRGDLLPLARLAYISFGQDPETLRPIPDPTWSDAMYYAVECMDYDYRAGSPAASARAYLDAGARAGMRDVRLGSVFYGDLPCAYWPVHPATSARPAPLVNTRYPVFVLASSTDPATPYAGALRIFNRLNNAYLVVQPGGPHVIFGRGNSCPDDLVTAFLVDGEVPAQRQTFCDWAGVDSYVSIPARTVDGDADALESMGAVDDEINTNGDYWNWDGSGTLRYGCLDGGWIAYVESDTGADLELHACAFSRGLPLSGGGVIDFTEGTLSLTVTGPQDTSLAYIRAADGARSVTGTWFGTTVSITQ